MFTTDVVNNIITGQSLSNDVTTKQAMVASEFINKYCGFNVDNQYPFCATPNFTNSQFASCTACNLLNNTLCHSIGKEQCDLITVN